MNGSLLDFIWSTFALVTPNSSADFSALSIQKTIFCQRGSPERMCRPSGSLLISSGSTIQSSGTFSVERMPASEPLSSV